MTAPAKPRLTGWYVDLDGKKSGPYSVEQIRELLMGKRILADQRVFSEAELPREGELPGERTSSRLLRVGELLDQYTDPALSLLDALQAAQGKKRPAASGNVQNAVAEDRNSTTNAASTSGAHAASRLARGVMNPDRKPNIPPQLAIFVATAMIAAAVVWGTLQFLRRSETILPPPTSQAAKDADGIKAASVGDGIGVDARTSHPAVAAHAPAVAPPAPATQTPNLGIASRIKPRPFSRPLASVPGQGRPQPPQTGGARDERDEAEVKEREQHEREAQDTGGGGGAPIDSDPGTREREQQAQPPAQPVDPNTTLNNGGVAAPEPVDPNLNQN